MGNGEEERVDLRKPHRETVYFGEDIVTWFKREVRHLLADEIARATRNPIMSVNEARRLLGLDSDLLFSEIRPVAVDDVIYIEYPDGRRYVADLCTPVYDQLSKELR